MRVPTLWLAVAMALTLPGCNKKKLKEASADADTTPSTASDGQPPKHVSSTGGVTAPNQNGNLTVSGGQGAVQSPRMAAARLVNEGQLKDLHLSMFQTWSQDNRMPSLNEVMKDVQQNRQLLPLVKEEVVILTGTNRGDGIWAYTQYPQRAGEHKVVTQQGVGPMATEELRKRLEDQGSPVKLSK